jgi:hypothetical protein
VPKRNGIRYEAYLLPEEDRAAQEIGRKLAAQGELWNSRHKKIIRAVNGRVPKYALAKYAIQQLFKAHGYDQNLSTPDEQIRQAMRRRTVL